MRMVTVTFESVSPYSQSRFHDTPKLQDGREKPDEYEQRTWRERTNHMSDGRIFIPPMAFKKSLETGAKFRGEKIKGKNMATYSKHFLAGVLVMDPLVLPVTKEDVTGERLFVPSDGKTGGGKRVMRTFPVIPEWSGDVTYHILDDAIITEDVFERTLIDAGNYIGVGRFRPERGGFYGRYRATAIKWDVGAAPAKKRKAAA
jgi:hypothetical protein